MSVGRSGVGGVGLSWTGLYRTLLARASDVLSALGVTTWWINELTTTTDEATVRSSIYLGAIMPWEVLDAITPADYTAVAGATKYSPAWGGVSFAWTSSQGRASRPFAGGGTGGTWIARIRHVDTGSGGGIGQGVTLTGGTDGRIWVQYNNAWYRGSVSGGAWSFVVVAASSSPMGTPELVRVDVAAGVGARAVSMYQGTDAENWDLIETINVDAAAFAVGGASGLSTVSAEVIS